MATKTRKTARGPLWTAVTKRWTIRALVAITVGLAIGAAGGAYTVHTFEPGRPDAVDSLQTMLDSMSRGTLKKPAAAPAPEPDSVATGEAPPPPSMLPVPDLIGMEEGAARNAILDAGFEVGAITFRPSPQPPGTVLSSTPVAGGQLAFGGEVALVLSDGRGGDTPSNSDFLPAP